jgi:hypothetical protein
VVPKSIPIMSLSFTESNFRWPPNFLLTTDALTAGMEAPVPVAQDIPDDTYDMDAVPDEIVFLGIPTTIVDEWKEFLDVLDASAVSADNAVTSIPAGDASAGIATDALPWVEVEASIEVAEKVVVDISMDASANKLKAPDADVLFAAGGRSAFRGAATVTDMMPCG